MGKYRSWDSDDGVLNFLFRSSFFLQLVEQNREINSTKTLTTSKEDRTGNVSLCEYLCREELENVSAKSVPS